VACDQRKNTTAYISDGESPEPREKQIKGGQREENREVEKLMGADHNKYLGACLGSKKRKGKKGVGKKEKLYETLKREVNSTGGRRKEKGAIKKREPENSFEREEGLERWGKKTNWGLKGRKLNLSSNKKKKGKKGEGL